MRSNDNFLASLIDHECRDSTARIWPSLVYSEGEGSMVKDVEGNFYIDLSAGFAALPIGHNHKEVQQELISYVESNGVMHGLGDVYASRAKVEFVETLKGFLPTGFEKVALSLTGGQAVEMAVKTAILYTQKPGVIALNQGYHGLDLGAMSLTGLKKFREPFKGFSSHPLITHIDSGFSVDDLREHIKALHVGGIEVGQIIVEPVLGRYGNKTHPDGWLRAVYDLTRELGILLIYDEVFTGLGRTGVGFRAEADPCDILCMGKAIGGGMPVSAIACSADIMNSWPPSQGEALHTGTFFGHPLSCLVGKKTLEIVRREALIDRSGSLGQYAVNLLMDNLSTCSLVTEIRGQGLMIAIEFTKDRLGVKLMSVLQKKGVILIPCGERGRSVSITPALNIPKEILEDAMGILINEIKTFQIQEKL